MSENLENRKFIENIRKCILIKKDILFTIVINNNFS